MESTHKTTSTVANYPKGSHPNSDQVMRKTAIFKKIEKLNDTQRQQLLFLIEQMERGENIDKLLTQKDSISSLTEFQGSSVMQKSENNTIGLMGARIEHKHELRIRILSTWGHIQV